MTRRTIAIIIALAMTAMLIPASAFAAPSGTAVTNAAGLRKVLTSGAGGSYYLSSDISGFTGSSVKVAAGTYTLDLNGHKISGHVDGGASPIILVCGGSLTIKDSAGGGSVTHTIGSDGSYADAVGSDSGTLTIAGGAYSGAYGTWCDGGVTNITGGSFTGDYYGAIVHGGTMNISGGTFSVNTKEDEAAAVACIPRAGNGSLNINGGTFKAEGSDNVSALNVSAGTCAVKGGTFTSKGYEAASHYGGSLSISGGSFTGASFGLLSVERYGAVVLGLSGGRYSGGVAGLAVSGKDAAAAGYAFTPSQFGEQSFGSDSFYMSAAAVSVVKEADTGERTYKAGQFKDVNEDAWYGLNGAKTIAGVWENRLMDGTSSDRFGVGTNLTIAQALVVADKIFCEHENGTVLMPDNVPGTKWYQFYVDYAIENGIIKAGEFSSYDAYATRAEMVHIFAHCLPQSEFAPLTIVEALPDVKESDKYGSEIFMFYRAGILSGSDKKGTFHPDSNIKREEAAAIFLHVYDADTRSVARAWFDSDPGFNWGRFPAGTENSCNGILASILKAGMTDREKAAAIHDFMVNSYHYDYDYANTGVSPYGDETFNYTCLLNHGCGVCEAYMELFSMLCAEAGVKCEMVGGVSRDSRGVDQNHGWNRVMIDGQWLHVDVTFDDPIYYVNGRITDYYSDRYLLITESEMAKDHTVTYTGTWISAI